MLKMTNKEKQPNPVIHIFLKLYQEPPSFYIDSSNQNQRHQNLILIFPMEFYFSQHILFEFQIFDD